ncbi:MAG: DUF1330 domain-containing protein [Pseudomonadales bacterium]|nr:DUF1330 domain-containing protein [Pseudomonadales bacterium]
MPFDRVVGLCVTNDEMYQNYRTSMKPILAQYGGKFTYDFRVSEVLASPTHQDINRVFILTFPNRANMEQFFSNEEYLQVKHQYFEPSVASTTIMATYER